MSRSPPDASRLRRATGSVGPNPLVELTLSRFREFLREPERLLFLAMETIVIVGFAWMAFGVKVHGALGSLAAVALLGAVAFGGLGLLLASRARTIEAVSGLMNLVMLPMWVLSGVFFASTNFRK